MSEKQKDETAAVAACPPLSAGLGLQKFCTVKDMNWEGEIMHGELKHSDVHGAYYMLEDGDCYQPEILAKHYDTIFLDKDPRVPNAKVTGSPVLSASPRGLPGSASPSTESGSNG